VHARALAQGVLLPAGDGGRLPKVLNMLMGEKGERGRGKAERERGNGGQKSEDRGRKRE